MFFNLVIFGGPFLELVVAFGGSFGEFCLSMQAGKLAQSIAESIAVSAKSKVEGTCPLTLPNSRGGILKRAFRYIFLFWEGILGWKDSHLRNHLEKGGSQEPMLTAREQLGTTRDH